MDSFVVIRRNRRALQMPTAPLGGIKAAMVLALLGSISKLVKLWPRFSFDPGRAIGTGINTQGVMLLEVFTNRGLVGYAR